jgi:transcriptional regulatory protein GAL4
VPSSRIHFPCSLFGRHLSNVERRLFDLEALCARLLPDVDIESALSSDLASPNVPSNLPLQKDSSRQSSTARTAENERGPIPDFTPDKVEGYDWAEDETSLDVLADGMAALRIEPTGAGYLGK